MFRGLFTISSRLNGLKFIVFFKTFYEVRLQLRMGGIIHFRKCRTTFPDEKPGEKRRDGISGKLETDVESEIQGTPHSERGRKGLRKA
jgi:hypothetical protein